MGGLAVKREECTSWGKYRKYLGVKPLYISRLQNSISAQTRAIIEFVQESEFCNWLFLKISCTRRV